MTDESLFEQALLLPEAERSAFLDHSCTGNPALRAEVDALLKADADPVTLLEPQPALANRLTRTHIHQSENPASPAEVGDFKDMVLAGKYRLLERIGEGGMGEVWLAQQTSPVKRQVAVKLIKAGMDSKQVLSRFETERQALAMMDHPNIAKVVDGGLQENRPFFVMELVKGIPITEYCDNQKLTPKQRLELFVPVCLAIQHAHQKGVIHRDIKPSNVLIALYDDRPKPKVIDFGVAKATGPFVSEHTFLTGFGGIVGTPQYMSPEQATLNNLDIDTRSDVYSLGVLLYELLTGTVPFAKAELEQKGLLEILRVVREEDPPRPSTKLSAADALPTVSANRRTDPKTLTGMLRNELDWIVMKSLEKDRGRRYESASTFAADVERYLSGNAVLAHPPTAGYRFRKLVRRHQGRVIAASLIILAILGGLVAMSFGLYRAEVERRKSQIAESNALDQFRLAEQAHSETMNSLATLQRHHDATRRALSELRVVFSSDSFLKTKPEQKAQAIALFQRMMLVFEQLADESPDAVSHWEKLANEYRVMGNGLFANGMLAEAESFYRKGIAHCVKLTNQSPTRIDFWHRRANLHADLALLLAARKQPQAAEEERRRGISLLEQALVLNPGRPETISQLANAQYYLAEFLRETGNQTAARDWYSRAIEQFAIIHPILPLDFETRILLVQSHWGRAKNLDASQREEEARADWARVAQLMDEGDSSAPLTSYQRGHLARICTSASLRLPDRKDQLIERAMQYLKRYSEKVPLTERQTFLEHKDWDPLRGREDFQKLVEGQPKPVDKQ